MSIAFFIGGFTVFISIFLGQRGQDVEIPLMELIVFCLMEGYLTACFYWGFTTFNSVPAIFKIVMFPFVLIGGLILSPFKIYQGVIRIRA